MDPKLSGHELDENFSELQKLFGDMCDPAKREATLKERGLDFLAAEIVFAGPTFSRSDDRHDYGEARVITAGLLAGRMVIIGWTPRGDDRHVFTR